MIRFSRLEVYQRLLDEGLVPIFVRAEPETAAQTLAVIAAGGATVCEFTNRSPQAVEAFRVAEVREMVRQARGGSPPSRTAI
jgi:2-dehydro-3-deoxyphosphogluconate aldolase/(4S)-4-hydroxy-2-oxoglutarate aldolase